MQRGSASSDQSTINWHVTHTTLGCTESSQPGSLASFKKVNEFARASRTEARRQGIKQRCDEGLPNVAINTIGDTEHPGSIWPVRAPSRGERLMDISIGCRTFRRANPQSMIVALENIYSIGLHRALMYTLLSAGCLPCHTHVVVISGCPCCLSAY